MIHLTITKGPTSFERIQTDEEGTKLETTEEVSVSDKQYLVSDEESKWIVDEKSFLLQEEDGKQVVYQGKNILIKGDTITKNNF